ncbi:3,4-dihydroxy-2-butanone-4-phosphate synthase [Thermaerobacter sp. PB12/4term]|uniref:3,4-dihydroxy-2-butanone-4-phosphate synthase n=1 Tax=Thermaerobacter sp. PB12/4term TaxID=2293838 RepID=UPI000E3297E0|nr:3,4-dihydroxy-2-butanone-4-phosphate synthase [Thermaerobacter sp. PB12/4term]
MFTGIVQGRGRCVDLKATGSSLQIWIEAPFLGQVRPGDSVAVDGVCLTVAAIRGNRLAFTVVPETLRVTTLGDLRPGDEVNVEPALRWGSPLGGHLVMGHVDGTGTVMAVSAQDAGVLMEIEAPADLVPFVAPKGSITVDGVSLTVVEVRGRRFTVALVPHTLEHTTLGRHRPGDRVNLEVDWLARYAARHPATTGAPVPERPARLPGTAVTLAPLDRPKHDAGLHAQEPDPVQRVRTALAALRAGGMVVVLDDDGREGEGDLVLAAQHATPDRINFMLLHGRGLICAAMAADRCQALGLPLMVDPPADPMGTPFTISVDARHGVTTGISAADRARTFQVLADPASTAADLVRPGHVFPLRARPWGVMERRGHTEAAVDLARLAGMEPVAAICEILGGDGTPLRGTEIIAWAMANGLPWVTVGDLVAYRLRHETLVRAVAETRLPTRHGEFRLTAFEYMPDGTVHLALTCGLDRPAFRHHRARSSAVRPSPAAAGSTPVLVRVHSQCLTGDALASWRCDCGDQLHAALERIGSEGRGALVYLAQEGRGIGLAAKIKAYALQDRGLDTVDANLALGFPADARDYGVAAQILRSLGLRRIRLLTNNPDKIAQLQGHGIEVAERVALPAAFHAENLHYLTTKRDRLGHSLDWLPAAEAAVPAGPSEGDGRRRVSGEPAREGE